MTRRALNVQMSAVMKQQLNELVTASDFPSIQEYLDAAILETTELSPTKFVQTTLLSETHAHLKTLARRHGIGLSEALRQIISERW